MIPTPFGLSRKKYSRTCFGNENDKTTRIYLPVWQKFVSCYINRSAQAHSMRFLKARKFFGTAYQPAWPAGMKCTWILAFVWAVVTDNCGNERCFDRREETRAFEVVLCRIGRSIIRRAELPYFRKEYDVL
jgi:hypothetical protein